MKRQILLTLAWVVAGATLLYSQLGLNLAWDFLGWDPGWGPVTAACGVGILGALVAMWFLGRTAGGRVLQVVSLMVCLVLLGFAVWLVREAKFTPLWYRSGITFLMLMPTAFWLCGPLRTWNRRTAKSS